MDSESDDESATDDDDDAVDSKDAALASLDSRLKYGQVPPQERVMLSLGY